MHIPMLCVDFNEMLEPDLVLLSQSNTKVDIEGTSIHLNEGLKVIVYCDDSDEFGNPDRLLAEGIVERNTSTGWGYRAKWCCRIAKGIYHQSELENI